MPVESYAPEGRRWGWSCLEDNCRDCGPDGPGFETREEAVSDLERHKHEEHGGGRTW